MKKMSVLFSMSAAIALTGAVFAYYPAIEEFLTKRIVNKHVEQKKESTRVERERDDKEIAIVKLTDEQTKKMALEIQTASPGTITVSLSTRGKIVLDPDRLAHIIPKVPGIVKEARKNIGSPVKAGEIIAVLESQEMADLKASYLAAASKEKLAQALFNREKVLYHKGISPGQDFLNAQNTWDEARINKQLTTQKLQAFGLSNESIESLEAHEEPALRDYDIPAPIDGTVLLRHLTTGEFIDHNSTIYEIADLSSVWVETGIYPKDLSRIHQGQQVEVINLEDLSAAKATLIYLSPTIEGETIAARAIARLDNAQGQWRPGLFVNVAISTDQIHAPIVINKMAIQQIEGCDCAFVVTENGFEKRVVQLGSSDNDNVEVKEGLKLGDRYVSKNPFLLKAEMNKDLAKDDD